LTRPIKFRVFDTVTNDMIQVKTLNFNKETGIAECAIDDTNINGDLGCEWRLMQYTGIKDKRDKEIYEGDVVLRKHVIPMNVQKFMGVVEFDENGRWRISNGLLGYSKALIAGHDSLSIIGNIYENSDLKKAVIANKRA